MYVIMILLYRTPGCLLPNHQITSTISLAQQLLDGGSHARYSDSLPTTSLRQIDNKTFRRQYHITPLVRHYQEPSMSNLSGTLNVFGMEGSKYAKDL